MNKKQNTWDLREGILALSHRWYEVLLFMLAGGVLGWVAILLWPSPYRATLDLIVGLNAYRSPYAAYVVPAPPNEFRLVDDYKYWQMNQLDALASSESVLSATLTRLQERDVYWRDFSPGDLQPAVDLQWRTAGEWHLIVEWDDPSRAAQAVEVWADVLVEFLHQAIDHSRRSIGLEIRLRQLAEDISALQKRQAVLSFVQRELKGWQDQLRSMEPERPLTSADHWAVLSLVARAADWNLAWEALLNEAPTPNAIPGAYLPWLDSTLTTLEQDLAWIPGQIQTWQEEHNALQAVYRQEIENSKAVSPTLLVELKSPAAPSVEKVRSPGSAALVGGLLGFLVWSGWSLARISWKVKP